MSAFEADRFNHSRTSPHGKSCQLSAKPRFLTANDSRVWLATNDQRLTTALKERLQQFSAATCEYTAADFHAMVQSRMIYHLHHRLHRSRFGIVSTVDEALDPGVHQRSGAHRTRFNCSKEIALSQPMVTESRPRFAQRDNLCVRCGIGTGDVAVPSPADNAIAAHDDGSDGDFSRFKRSLGSAESFLHPKFVCFGCRLLVVRRSHRDSTQQGNTWRAEFRSVIPEPEGAFRERGR